MRNLSLFLFIIMASIDAFSQITYERKSPTFQSSLESSEDINRLEVAVPDLREVNLEDKRNANNKEIPWRFGVLIPVELDLRSNGSWEYESNWAKWTLKIHSKEATSLNLNFNKFYLSKNAELIIYNQHGIAEMEAINFNNNKRDSLFSIRPIQGDEITLELMVPITEKNQVKLNIEGLVYGYRNIYQKLNKTFNASGPCNININCPEGDKWQTIKRSIALIGVSNNTRFCTGTLVNNVRKDSTPYFLTATHCPVQNSSITIFGYESSNCSPSVNGSRLNSISGNIPRALTVRNDFRLVELSSTPPPSYNVFYSGWSAEGVANFQSTAIHHPQGDVMKISYDEDTLRSSRYNGGLANTHWMVGDWEYGTTEIGSSGSPLFDLKKRVIGQLHGGNANCQNIRGNDFYGKFSESWDFRNLSNEQLKFWLDPDTTNTLVLDGLDPIQKNFNNDIELTLLYNFPRFNCDTSLSIKSLLFNNGGDTIKNLRFTYGTNGNLINTFNWSGSLKSDSALEVSLPLLRVNAGDTTINVRVDLVNIIDQDLSNNGFEKPVVVNNNPETVKISIKTDGYGNETTWSIADTNDIILHKGGPYVQTFPNTAGRLYTTDLCLYDGCFDLKLYDSQGDGFTGFFGNGWLLIEDINSDTLLYINNFTGDSLIRRFCVPDLINSIKEAKENLVKVFPNPIKAGEVLHFDNLQGVASIEVYDLQGRIVLNKSIFKQLEIPSNFSPGVYYIRLYSRERQKPKMTKLLVN